MTICLPILAHLVGSIQHLGQGIPIGVHQVVAYNRLSSQQVLMVDLIPPAVLALQHARD
jgi:hypothetical protein